eukprot:EG_transcript_5140
MKRGLRPALQAQRWRAVWRDAWQMRYTQLPPAVPPTTPTAPPRRPPGTPPKPIGRSGPAWRVPPPEDPSGGTRRPMMRPVFARGAPPDLHTIRSKDTDPELEVEPGLNAPRRMVDDLAQVSEFDRKQIAHLYRHFCHLAGRKGYLTQQDFAVNFHLMGTMDSEICARYFDLFDRNGNGQINFEEFVLGLGLLFRVVRDDKSVPPQIVKENLDAKLMWTDDAPPRKVLVIKKWNDETILQKTREICKWLTDRGLQIIVEDSVRKTEMPECEVFLPNTPKAMTDIDFCICLGGDGTLLHLASLVQDARAIPPVLPFAMGSLGFLTPFKIDEYEDCLTRVLNARHKSPLYCTLRSRLKCEVWVDGKLRRVRRVLNECLIDRGASPFLSKLNCSIDGHQVTTVQADGLIIGTPSGSTAYNSAAGGAMVVPSVACVLITPIAPHSLSFRPIIVPDTATIEISIPETARAPARASFDGRHEEDLPKGSRIRIHMSRRPLPIINMHRRELDWFNSIKSKLGWNVRVEQKPGP